MPWQTTERRDWRGGENLADNRRVLLPNQAVLLENTVVTGHGQAEKRKGMTLMPGSATHPGRVEVLHPFRPSAATLYWMVVSANALRLHDGTLLRSGLAAGPYGTAVFAGKFLLVDGTEYYESDGTAGGTLPVPLPADTGATLAEVRRCRLLLTVRDRVYAAGDPQVPHAVYYSQPNRHDYFKTGDMRLLVGQHDGLPIVLLLEMFGGILVGKASGFWLIKGDPASLTTLTIDRLVSGIGPTERCFATDGADLWFVHQKRWHILRQLEDNVWSALYVGHPHSPLHAAGDWSSGVMIYFDDRVLGWFRHPDYGGVSGNNLASVADLRFKSQAEGRFATWTRFTNWPVSAAAVDQGALWAGLEDGKLVRLFDGSTDLGTAVRWRVYTAENPLGDSFLMKLFDGVNIEAAQTGTRPVRFTHEVVIGVQRQSHTWEEAFVSVVSDTQADWQQGVLGVYLRDLQGRALSSL